MRTPIAAASLAALLFAAGTALAAPDAKQGKVLHDKLCTGCHVRLVGGDGSEIYTRKERAIRDKTALAQRISFCSSQVNAGLFPEDEANIAAYLNERFYKFK